MSELAPQLGGQGKALDVAVTEDLLVVLGPVDVQRYVQIGFYAANTDGDDITAVVLETAPEATGPWTWIGDDIGAAGIAEDGGAYGSFSGAVKYVRIRAQCGAGDSATASFWLCAAPYLS